jgi:hypothetical protein
MMTLGHPSCYIEGGLVWVPPARKVGVAGGTVSERGTCSPMTVIPAAEHTPLQERLRRLRAEYGLSYQLLSERSGVDVAYLHRIETGKAHRPSRDILIRIALGLGLEIEAADSLVRAGGHVPLLPRAEAAAQKP